MLKYFNMFAQIEALPAGNGFGPIRQKQGRSSDMYPSEETP